MKPRISILYLGRKGGIAHYTLHLAAALAELSEVTCFVSEFGHLVNDFRAAAKTKAFPTYRSFPEFIIHSIRRSRVHAIAAALERAEGDVCIDTGSGPWGNLVKRRTRSLPWATVVHDPRPHDERIAPLSKLAAALWPDPSSTLIALSRVAANDLSVAYPGRLVITSSHGAIHHQRGRRESPEEIASRRKRFLFFGRVEAYKGIPDLVRAFQIAKRAVPDLQLTILGAGPIDAGTVELIRDLRIELRNRWVTEDEILSAFGSHGVVVLPYREATQSGVAAAALGSGLPLVATMVGALPEQVKHECNGLLVPPKDPVALANAMERIAFDKALAVTLAGNASRFSDSEGNWMHIARDLLASLRLGSGDGAIG